MARIAVYPPMSDPVHPYFTAFHSALLDHGVEARDDLEISRRWIKSHARDVDAIHVHWPETIWQGRGFEQLSRVGRGVRAIHRLIRLATFLRAARRAGMCRIWTVHNLEPHEGSYRWDRYGYRLLAAAADVVVCHSHWSGRMFRDRYHPAGAVVVMPIGDLSNGLPTPRPRAKVIAALGLNPQLPVVSCLGLIREYKSADLACRAVECLRGQVQLVIGGKPIGGFDMAPLREAARRAPYVVVIARRLSDQEIADVIAASDAVLLPYRKITGSAVLMSALGAGCGVVAADLPYFREMLSPEFDAGVLVEGRDETTWARAIAAYVARDPAARRQAALRLADRYRWDRSVAHVLDAIENASSRSHPSSIEVSRRRLHA